MTLIPYSQINNVKILTEKEEGKIKDFLQGAIYSWCKNRPDEWFAVKDLLGGENSDWRKTPLIVLYDKYFEKKMKDSRMKFGTNFVLSSKFIKLMEENANSNKIGVYGFLSDQSPQLQKAYYWKEFMGVKVPVVTGHEMLAKKFDYPVVYLQTDRIKRGYYKSKMIVLAENPNDYPDYQITDMYLDLLEKQIRAAPEYYFWTHKRFKHKDRYEEWIEKNVKTKQ